MSLSSHQISPSLSPLMHPLHEVNPSSPPLSSSPPWTWSDGSTTTVSTSQPQADADAGYDPTRDPGEFVRELRERLGALCQEKDGDEVGVDGEGLGKEVKWVHVFQESFKRTQAFGTNTDMDTDADTEMACPSPSLDLSPIVFASRSPSVSPSQPNFNPTGCMGYRSRTIHRACSFLPTSLDEDSEPPFKRPKILTRTSTHTRLRTQLVHTPASLRRAASLRSVPDASSPVHTPPFFPVPPLIPKRTQTVPTESATPQTTILVPTNAHLPSKRKRTGVPPAPLGNVPIIAPPHPLPAPPTEKPAVVRVKWYLERERGLRREMGLSDTNADSDYRWGWEIVGERLRGEVVRWFLEVVPPAPTPDRSDDGEEETWDASFVSLGSKSSSTASPRTCSSTSTSTSTSTRSASPSSSSTSTTTTTTNSTAYSTSIRGQGKGTNAHGSNLHDQLAHSPATRFHAAYLFLRFFWACSESSPSSSASERHEGRGVGYKGDADNGDKGGTGEMDSAEEPEGSWPFGGALARDEEGRVLFTWDVAVACLSVGVKYNRDFLHPLRPVYAYEFARLAPHGHLGFEDLEVRFLPALLCVIFVGKWAGLFALDEVSIPSADVHKHEQIAHRDLLAALAFRLGDTPQALLIELWEALPALRALLSGLHPGERGGEEGDAQREWNLVLRETWRGLFAAVCEHDVLRFPLSLLTSAALLHGLRTVLMWCYEDAASWYVYELCAAPGPPALPNQERLDRAEKGVRGVEWELRGLLGVEEVSEIRAFDLGGGGRLVLIGCFLAGSDGEV
ncbi:hypothetical protein DXG01_007581 [Tephrocybe rancida]|nr:hypothetical protein DXG01_007581 [Tephrocybe rancida]